ncbi:MAG: DUF2970 domain-containing protein [Pseudomonadota bacterium]|nr:DUF2970 domain-containing protein [Pseudomonadota bacterium]
MSANESPGFLGVMKSVLSAFLGIQSTANHERDISHGKPSHYILIGLLFTGLFVLIVWGVVSLVLHLAGVA